MSTRSLRPSHATVALSVAVALALGLALPAERPPLASAATTWYVAPSGKDSNTCTAPSTPCRHIQTAIGKAAAGDTLRVATGTYTETLTITSSLTLLGAGTSATVISWGGAQVQAGTVAISGFTLNGGGGVSNVGTLTLSHSQIVGAGITNNGTMSLRDSTVSGNRVGGAGEGAGSCAGIDNQSGTMTIYRSTISGNSVNSDQYGNAGSGAGLCNENGSTLYLLSSTVSGNTAGPGDGCGIVHLGAGGGIANSGLLYVLKSTISGNSAGIGGGIANASSGQLHLSNSTVSGNTAPPIHSSCTPETLYGAGGGINNDGGVLTVANSTLSGNAAPGGQGGGVFGPAALQNSILAGNSVDGRGQGPDCAGALTSNGDNLLGNNGHCSGLTNGVNGDQVGTPGHPLDARLGPLQANGGPTPTMALLAGSPALGAGNPTGCRDFNGTLLMADQRGQPRPDAAGERCDSGAFELQD